MDPQDLLYSNRFTRTESLSRQQLEEDANNFVPYRTLKGETVNNVRDELLRTYNTNNPITQRQLRAYGWNRGEYGNQRPVLSEFAQDIGESSYFRYKTTYLNIDSRMRDVANYPRPNNYSMFLGRKFENIETIKLVDYFFPEIDFAINKTNNVMMWFTLPYEMINLFRGGGLETVPYTLNTGSLNILSWYMDFNLLIDKVANCEDSINCFTNNIYKNWFKFEVPPGNYTTEEMKTTLKDLWSETQFFNSNFITTDPYNFWSPDSDPTKALYQTPQLVNIRINPDTSEVDFMLRYEELKVTSMISYKGTNYFDIYLDTQSPYTEYLQLANNDIFPLILTDFPGIGGLKAININYIEFIPKHEFDMVQALFPAIFKTYYDIVKDGSGVPITNALRFYMYNTYSQPIIFSYSETLSITDPCQKLCDALVGREAPFFLINGTDSPLFEFIKSVNNQASVLNRNACQVECDTTNPSYCQIVSTTIINYVNKYLCNPDGTSRILTNLLGFFDTANSIGLVGPSLYARAIQPNIIYKANAFIPTIQTFSLITQESWDYLDCVKKAGETADIILAYKSNKILDFKLPICKDSSGTYSFYLNNYIFLKLLNPALRNQNQGSEIVQIKPTSAFAFGSSDVYEYSGESVKGFEVFVSSSGPTDCTPPESSSDKTNKRLAKNVDDLFAKIKFSCNVGSCCVDNLYINENVYFDGSVTSLDNFIVQLVDYEGKLLETTKNHNFVLMIVEKIEVLKETNINSRTGFANTTGTNVVQRNNFSR